MTDFKVKPDDIGSYSTQIGRAADDVQAAKKYVNSHTEVGWYDNGLISNLANSHDSLVTQLGEALTKTESILRACQTELTAVSRYYDETDRGNASDLDAKYPESKR
ncbi:type VII secretion target [Streptomyces sp. LHD-70]|uniref:type VII secretion target n=1 Tax=Streptomyces sp. LHD-70 TaxID=3072140 RepID=UPI00280E6182|nr:type VII secretion target [Streptomyces sp. LHD-70]MDQ8702427.1 type VII secretion target [Streptomyces sp. LHD-70]